MIGAADIGGSKIAVGIVDDSGAMLANVESPTAGERGFGITGLVKGRGSSGLK